MKKIIKHITNHLNILKNKKEEIRKKKENETSLLKNSKGIINGRGQKEISIDIPISVTFKTLSIIVLFLFFGQILMELKSIVIMTAISFFLALGLAPLLTSIERFMPRPLAILSVYFAFIGALFLLFFGILPILAQQLSQIAVDMKTYLIDSQNHGSSGIIADLLGVMDLNVAQIKVIISQNISLLSNNLQTLAGSTWDILVGIFQGIFNLTFTLILLFFILMEREALSNFLLSVLPSSQRILILRRMNRIQKKMSEWFKAQAILMACMGIFIYIGMKIFEFVFGMKYAATIAFLAAFMELFPYIGVFITGAFAILIALNISFALVFAIVILILISQFLEGNVLVPLVMEKVVGLSSVAVILAISIGGVLGNSLGGISLSIIGMVLSIPIAASISILLEEYIKRKQ